MSLKYLFLNKAFPKNFFYLVGLALVYVIVKWLTTTTLLVTGGQKSLKSLITEHLCSPLMIKVIIFIFSPDASLIDCLRRRH